MSVLNLIRVSYQFSCHELHPPCRGMHAAGPFVGTTFGLGPEKGPFIGVEND
jgi:hypothetical protein